MIKCPIWKSGIIDYYQFDNTYNCSISSNAKVDMLAIPVKMHMVDFLRWIEKMYWNKQMMVYVLINKSITFIRNNIQKAKRNDRVDALRWKAWINSKISKKIQY